MMGHRCGEIERKHRDIVTRKSNESDAGVWGDSFFFVGKNTDDSLEVEEVREAM